MKTVIEIPDLRVCFNKDTGAILFPNIKELEISKLVEVYWNFEATLKTLPGVIVSKNGDICGVRK